MVDYSFMSSRGVQYIYTDAKTHVDIRTSQNLEQKANSDISKPRVS